MESYVGSALTNQEGARALAKKIFQIYDKDQSGVIEAYEIGTHSDSRFFLRLRKHDDRRLQKHQQNVHPFKVRH